MSWIRRPPRADSDLPLFAVALFPLDTSVNGPSCPASATCSNAAYLSAYGARDMLNIATARLEAPEAISTGRLSRPRIRMFDGWCPGAAPQLRERPPSNPTTAA